VTHRPVEDDPLGTELVKLSLAARQYLPYLVSDYLGPYEWLVASRAESTDLVALQHRALALTRFAEHASDAYVAAQARAIATRIEVQVEPHRYGYVELVERLLACRFVEADPLEIDALAREIHEIASNLGFSGPDAVQRWESGALVTGEAKWDIAMDAYREGRRFALERFPLPFEERLDIRRTKDPTISLHLTWREPDHMVFEVNVTAPRTPATIRYEVAHDVYPGDYLHMAVLSQRTFGEEGKVAACIKLRNAPENVIAEGIEEVAPFRLDPRAGAETQLAWKLEWLRRAASLTGAVLRRERGVPRAAAIEHLQRVGQMSEARALHELDHIEHPLWGAYQYTYWLGRHLVEASDREAGDAVTGAPYLGWLYGGLHVPETFLAEARRTLAGAVIS
jgi:hypothetical protein